ncbi:MAG: hypothetical protein LJE91_12120 [Gammaproteobacteria bacterium]|nr:hypothetical protein [Gammaproteobacteria bacterium]
MIKMDRVFLVVLMLALSHLALAQGSTEIGADSVGEWQLSRLFHPTESQRRAEERGQIFIYEGLKDTDVVRAMDEEFDRVESMMFAGTVVTDPQGKELRDPKSGEVVSEDDGCD